MRSYHNSNRESGAVLEHSEANAKAQEAAILMFFKFRPRQPFSPWDVQREIMPDTPITSIRRAMTNLTTAGKLEKSTRTYTGHSPFNKAVHLWRLQMRKESA